ncbi:MAG: hypothetical protein DRG78_11125 [Epsilonproteobacteria bacterium]|nr:MAG: hypothetical protein DRG78_11125 [Campylobacterota bacterium]
MFKNAPKTIAIVNLIKGGSGKSTLAVNLTAATLRANLNTMLIDLDVEQRAAHKWALKRNIECQLNPPINKISNIVKSHDLTIFDTGGYDTGSTQALMTASDVILIPTSMSPIETEAFFELINKINKIKEILKKDDLNIFIVPNRIQPGVTSTKVAAHFAPLKKLGYKIAPTLYRRTAYEKSYANGGSVFEYNDLKAQSEIYNLFEKLFNKGK